MKSIFLFMVALATGFAGCVTDAPGDPGAELWMDASYQAVTTNGVTRITITVTEVGGEFTWEEVEVNGCDKGDNTGQVRPGHKLDWCDPGRIEIIYSATQNLLYSKN